MGGGAALGRLRVGAAYAFLQPCRLEKVSVGLLRKLRSGLKERRLRFSERAVTKPLTLKENQGNQYNMKLREVMTKDPVYIKPDTTLQEAASKMRELDVGLLPVGDGVKLRGMLTDRDITIRAAAEGLDPKSTRVEDVMTKEVLYAFEDQDIEDAVHSMEEKQVRRLIILDRDKNMTGIVALADLATRTSDEHEKAEVLEGVSKH